MAGRSRKHTPRARGMVIEERVDEVYKMLLNGISDREIMQYSARNWDIQERQTKTYIARANELLRESAAVVREVALGKSITRLERMYAKAMAAGNLKLALAIQREMNQLLGLYAPTRTELTGAQGGPIENVTIELTDEERTARVTALLDAARARRDGSVTHDAAGQPDA